MKVRLCFVANSSSSDYMYIRCCNLCDKPLDYCDCDGMVPTHTKGQRKSIIQRLQQELPFVEQEVRDEVAPWIRFK